MNCILLINNYYKNNADNKNIKQLQFIREHIVNSIDLTNRNKHLLLACYHVHMVELV